MPAEAEQNVLNPAAISSSLYSIFSFRVWGHLGKESRGADVMTCAPFAWLERNAKAPVEIFRPLGPFHVG